MKEKSISSELSISLHKFYKSPSHRFISWVTERSALYTKATPLASYL